MKLMLLLTKFVFTSCRRLPEAYFLNSKSYVFIGNNFSQPFRQDYLHSLLTVHQKSYWLFLWALHEKKPTLK